MAGDEFDHPRLAAIYDAADGPRDDLDAYERIVVELGASSVLDVGCGTGELACRLAIAGLDVVGLDPAAAMLAVARSKPGADRVRWVHGAASAVPAGAIDLATMTGNVAQVFLTEAEWAEALAAIRRALRPSGHLVFETRVPARRAWERWTPDRTRARIGTPLGPVEVWCELTDVEPPYVSFRWTHVFESDGVVVTSDSTLRFRSRDEVLASLDAAGFEPIDVRDAPDRPGDELVFVAATRQPTSVARRSS